MANERQEKTLKIQPNQASSERLKGQEDINNDNGL
jgi:hypothetical protein